MVHLIAVLVVLAQVTGQAPAAKETTAALETLKKADMFIVGPYGFYNFYLPRPVSPGERALLTVLQDKTVGARLLAMIKDATPAGKAYILLGLRHSDRAAYQVQLKELKSSELTVRSIGGCIHYARPLSSFVDQIEKGRYDTFIKSPAPPSDTVPASVRISRNDSL